MDVGIRELKKNLSHYIELASKGEVFRVTHRGKPVAHVGPIPGKDRLEEGIAEGWIRPGNGEPPVLVVPVSGNRSIQSLMDEDRG